MRMARFERNDDWVRAIGGGIVAGIIGGFVLWVLMAGMTLAAGGDIWPVFKGASAPFLGERAGAPGFDPIAVPLGAACHFLVSSGWGLLFALLVYGMGRGLTVLLGALWGIVVWLGMYYVVLPLVGLGTMQDEGALGTAVALHVVFGFAVGVAFLPFQVPRRGELPRRRAREPVTP